MGNARDEIVKAAYKLFRLKGVSQTGLNEILKESNTGKSQLYHYFKNKEHLVQESLNYYAEKVFTETSRFMHKIESLDEFEDLIEGSIRLCTTQNTIVGCLVGSISAELSSNDEVIRLHCVHIYEKWKNLFIQGLVRLQAKGLLAKNADSEELAEYFLTTVQGAFLMAKTTGDISFISRTMSKSINYIRSYSL